MHVELKVINIYTLYKYMYIHIYIIPVNQNLSDKFITK